MMPCISFRAGFVLLLSMAEVALIASGPRGPTVLPTGNALLAADGLQAFTSHIGTTGEVARFQIVAANGPGFDHAWRVDTIADTIQPWEVNLRAENAIAVQKGDVGMIRFFARVRETADETGAGRMMLVIQSRVDRGKGTYEGDFPLTREWQEILVPFSWLYAFGPREAEINLRFGFKHQSVEIGGISAIHYGRSLELASLPRTRFSYLGRESGAPWRREALDRIERIRKGDIRIQVSDTDGRALKEASVRVRQTRSAFDWATSLEMRRLVVDSPENLRFREVVLELFNAASTENDLKWPSWERAGTPFSHEQTLQGLKWLRERGFHTRGHVLVWPRQRHFPKAVQDLYGTPRQAELPEIVIAHIRAITRATKGLLDEWDVLNEPYTNHDLMDFFGDDIMVSWFRTAREELPHAKLFLNDFSNDDITADPEHVAHFERTIRFLIGHGAPLDGLGLQAHFSSRPSAPANILATLDRYWKEFRLPVRFTEFDIPTSDEELQADFTRDFLILAYSHPSVVGVQHWGFWEGRHWKPPAAMYRLDWSEKPNAKAYKDLVLHQWRTDMTSKTDAAGRLSARGFHGEYQVTVTLNGRSVEKSFTLAPGSESPWLITLPD